MGYKWFHNWILGYIVTKNQLVMRIFHLILILGLFGCVVFSQEDATTDLNQQFGIQYKYHNRNIGHLQTQSNVETINYRYHYGDGDSYISFILGMNDFLIKSQQRNVTDMASKLSMLYQAGIFQSYKKFYIKGTIVYYKAKGTLTETENDSVQHEFENNYSFVEYPLGVGLAFKAGRIKTLLGAHKSYFYGQNTQRSALNISGYEINLGKQQTTFIDELPIGYEAEINIVLYREISLELGYKRYKHDDYTLRISLCYYSSPVTNSSY